MTRAISVVADRLLVCECWRKITYILTFMLYRTPSRQIVGSLLTRSRASIPPIGNGAVSPFHRGGLFFPIRLYVARCPVKGDIWHHVALMLQDDATQNDSFSGIKSWS